MKKFLLLTLTIFCIKTANATDITVNNNVLQSLKTTQEVAQPKFPIMPKRVVKKKTTPKKVVKKKPAPKKVVAKKPAPAPVAQNTEEQIDLQKEFDSMQPVKTIEPTATPVIPTATETQTTMPMAPAPHTPKTLELMPGAKVAPLPEDKKEKAAKPEPKKTPVTKVADVKKIVFESAEAKLSDNGKKEIDAIIKTFKDAKNNKIAITAYNLEDSKNAFKQKRQALNHALEIRNYLVSKGYNNSSLRVLTVKGQPEKLNVVEISESE